MFTTHPPLFAAAARDASDVDAATQGVVRDAPSVTP